MNEKIKDLLWSLKKNRKAQILIAAIVLLLVVVTVLAVVVSSDSSNENEDEIDETNTNSSEQLTGESERRLDGVEVDVAVSNLFPIAIIVENLESVRPQSGLSSANVVYETLAEGGITRFMAVYATDEVADPIGPVRSARHYFVDWAEEYGGFFAHVGGSPQALGILGTTDYMTDLNQFAYSEYYYRDDNLFAPHNLFSSSELMEFAVRDLELTEKSGDFEPYIFKAAAEKGERPESVNPIIIDFSSDAYEVRWEYNRDSNSYTRFNGGEAHTDANTGAQLSTTNIAVQYVETTVLEQDTGRLDIITVSSGEAIVFRDGEAIEGTWEKAERGDRTKFYDENGSEIKFNAGTTWIEAVPQDQEVTY